MEETPHIKHTPRRRKGLFITLFITCALLAGLYLADTQQKQSKTSFQPSVPTVTSTSTRALQYPDALHGLDALEVKGRAPKTGYSRTQFGDGWEKDGSCDTRNHILARDLVNVTYKNHTCVVLSGTLQDPYTGKLLLFTRGQDTSGTVQIDHVVALSDAWQKGAQLLTPKLREQFANDSLELLAVDGTANQSKSDGDAATWLPPNNAFRCNYVARQVSVKLKYSLWVTSAEKAAIQNILNTCPTQPLPS